MLIRRLILPSALLYESIEDFKCDVAFVISSSLKILLVTFPGPINNAGQNVTYCSQTSCIVGDMGCQISHTCYTNIDSSIDHDIMSFNFVREYVRDVEFPQLLTEVI